MYLDPTRASPVSTSFKRPDPRGLWICLVFISIDLFLLTGFIFPCLSLRGRPDSRPTIALASYSLLLVLGCFCPSFQYFCLFENGRASPNPNLFSPSLCRPHDCLSRRVPGPRVTSAAGPNSPSLPQGASPHSQVTLRPPPSSPRW